MSCLCWGDAERTRKLKQALSKPEQLEVSALELLDKHKKESDTSSGGRTSCSSHDIWDDDDCSDDGSVSSSFSRSPSPVSKTAVTEPLQLALEACQNNWKNEHKTQPPLPSGSPTKHRMKDHESYLKTLRTAAFGLRRVMPIVVPAELVPPTEYDLRSTNGLMKCVNAISPMPTAEQMSAKHLAINELQRTVDIWLRRTLDKLEGVATQSETKSTETATLLLGGSWHLKVGNAESDLDVVAFMPHSVTAEIFFSSLCEHLGQETSVSDLVARRKAAVPVLSFQLNAVRIDLLFARYAQKQAVPKHLPFLPGDDMQVMRGMDATSVRSLSVARVASLILELVPNASVFRSCLRVIRLWARCRGLYSNKAGYLGGISWALLVCFVCQMFPRASVASLVHRFFSVLASWRWPTPILVAHPSNGGKADNEVQWDPQHNIHDRAHLMPIITPGFPAVNTAVNVNISTLRVLREEFARGQRIMDDLRRRSLSHPSSWNQLFTPTEVLVRYDHHVAIELRAPTEEALAEWSSFVASRTRKLVETLQHTPLVSSLHPLPDLVRPQGKEANENNAVVGYYFIGYTVNAPMPQPRRGDRRHPARTPVPSKMSQEELAKNSVASATRYFLATELDTAAEKKPGMEVEINYRSWNDLPSAIFPGGRKAAVGDRARYILSQAHHVNLALGLAR
ncbi:hypothetical protein PPTG_09479 [Phytophthora nicotianae INRA-310]|uniref:polynucleotide adenylyltransferase n=1 Tax=Phytophthora nicotianae (strain INRA-310) TaxID=761204 RepID=W2QG08_PHYN3|nr:hypothetical protein PPTG_09479 [Phytophthora nicotianae INRA-310]ETN11786.1 hypothetical protein PPTG_09479 [Phytophthora nicotianae INRA-310]